VTAPPVLAVAAEAEAEGPKPVGRAVSVRGWKNRLPGAAGTLFTITEVFLGMIKLSSKYSKRDDKSEV
jgi:hypothetical protein